jgi:transcriptional regulator with XRE-family HTH domain
MTHALQALQASFLLERLEALNLPQKALADLTGISESGLSSFCNGKRGLSLVAQREIFGVLRWARELTATSATPVDFGNREAIRKLWKEYRAATDEGAVVRALAEIAAEKEEANA